MKKLLFAGLLASTLSSHAASVVPFAAGERALSGGASAALPSPCSFSEKRLPEDTIVVAAGGYSGRPLEFQIDQSGNAATQFDVAVHADKPVALMLSAYAPTIWSIGWTRDTRVVAVFVTGYHRQAVAGLPRGTPVIVSSFTEKGVCGSQHISSERGLEWVNPAARAVFGKPATRVYARASGGLFDIVESSRPKTPYVTSLDVKPESFRDPTAPLAGQAGLRDAVARGLLRAVTSADIEQLQNAWRARAKAAEPANPPDVPPVAGVSGLPRPDAPGPYIPVSRTYVVVKSFTYPAGLTGANAATFIVPAGVPSPSGDSGHSRVFDLNKGLDCDGAQCR